ncbi:unnamed protein product [Clonostachys rosea f. rosea IK726]|uniref:Methyltransferase domain-containing protein n=2 Tax=Bionectria ochroleuca TaxID=29856 RepID=A0A0B7JUV6_BIOOC|nr:unnamed protein product [Clonostachys rosea f. rosea IK726]
MAHNAEGQLGDGPVLPLLANQGNLPDPLLATDIADSDIDSGYGDSIRDEAGSISSSMSSLYPPQYHYGRRYHGLNPGSYQIPDDDLEQARLSMVDYMFQLVLHERLHLAPVPSSAAVLDIGTGTGHWAVQFGDQYPDATVLGIDLSPIQPQWVPPNVRFALDDVEQDWQDDEPYDYIHCRYMGATLSDWPRLFSQAFDNLQPGGWLELQELVNVVLTESSQDPNTSSASSHQPVPPEHPMARLIDNLTIAFDKLGRPFNPGPNFKRWCEEAGFRNVTEQHFTVPIGDWHPEPRMRELGSLMAVNIAEGVDAYTTKVFQDTLAWDQKAVADLNADVQAAVQQSSRDKLLYELVVVTAQKPHL